LQAKKLAATSAGARSLGFNLVEWPVVIAIIGVLVAILLRQFQAAREGCPGAASVRTTCGNCRSQRSTTNRREGIAPDGLEFFPQGAERSERSASTSSIRLGGMRLSWDLEICP